jgi:hypothetical protein
MKHGGRVFQPWNGETPTPRQDKVRVSVTLKKKTKQETRIPYTILQTDAYVKGVRPIAALKSERNAGNGMKLGGATLLWARVFRE